jgi:dephospho-CoA kinase
VVVFEAPVLLESGWSALVDEIWVTVASEATVLRRLEERAGFSEAESRARIRSQLPAGERMRRADIVIDTDCTLDELKAKVRELWCRLDARTCGVD